MAARKLHIKHVDHNHRTLPVASNHETVGSVAELFPSESNDTQKVNGTDGSVAAAETRTASESSELQALEEGDTDEGAEIPVGRDAGDMVLSDKRVSFIRENSKVQEENNDTVRSITELLSNVNETQKLEGIANPALVTIPNGRKLEVTAVDIAHGRRMGLDAGDMVICNRQMSFRRANSVRSRVSVKKKNRSEYILQVVVGILFCTIVLGVSLIFHFYHQQQKILELGAVIKVNEVSRAIRIEDAYAELLLTGTLGTEIPNNVQLNDCSIDNTRKTHLCLKWKDWAELNIDYKNYGEIQCYDINWEALHLNTVLQDCYYLDKNVHWHGGGIVNNNNVRWNLEPPNSINEKLFHTGSWHKKSQFGPVIERYWFTSKRTSIFAPSNYSLYVSSNEVDVDTNTTNNLFCLKSEWLPSKHMHTRGVKPFMNYTICSADNIKQLHHFSLQTIIKNDSKESKFPTDLLRNSIWSTYPVLHNFTLESLKKYAHEVIKSNLSHNHLIINSNWEQHIGDFVFDKNDYLGNVPFLNDLQKEFKLCVAVTPFVDIKSNEFLRGLEKSHLVADYNSAVPALLTYYDPLDNVKKIVGASEFQSPWFKKRLLALKSLYNISSILLRGGEMDNLPFAARTPPGMDVNWYTEQYLKVSSTVFPYVFTESAAHSQGLQPIVVMPSLPSTWEGLQSVLSLTFSIGLAGYPIILPEVIGGSTSNVDNVPDNLPEKELYIRWLQLSAFLPIMHFSLPPSAFDVQTENIAKQYVQLHANYVYKYVQNLTQTLRDDLQPIIRPISWIAPLDESSYGVEDQFLIGDFILVAPILTNGSVRSIYLPEGKWQDMLTNEHLVGPKFISEYHVQLHQIPYFEFKH